MILAIASGKGGTGKTTVALGLAHALAHSGTTVRLLDCDVEEPNAHLFIAPDFQQTQTVTVRKPVWDAERCTRCGQCVDACRYHALASAGEQILLIDELCHACGVCSFVCPENAFTETPVPVGTVQIAPDHRPFAFAHGTLDIGQAAAPTVIRAVKEHIDGDAVTILDGPPGTNCPAVETIRGADAVILVTEPTPFGLHDLRLAAAMTLTAGRPAGIVINRSDGDDTAIADFAATANLPILGRIPFRRAYAEACSRGAILTDAYPELTPTFTAIADAACALRGRPVPPPPPLPGFTVVPDAGRLSEPARAASGHREIAVISGKGGTGKTTVTASLAALLEDIVIADSDVDAADLHLLLAPAVLAAHPFVDGAKAAVDPKRCIACGRCAQECHFDAIERDGPGNDFVERTFRIDAAACEGCGLCARVCPAAAITEATADAGAWYVSRTARGPMVHAALEPGEENSGRLVTRVREQAAAIARERCFGAILADGPPGTGCPVIASVNGCDLLLVVTEPTVSGVHDLERVLQLASHFRLPARLVINKADLNHDQGDRIARLADRFQAPIVARIPFDPLVHQALVFGRTVVEHRDGPAADAIRALARDLQPLLKGKTP